MIAKRRKRTPTTLAQWRQDKTLCSAASKLMNENEVMSAMLGVVEGASPLHGNQLSFGSQVTEHDHSRHLGRIEGYSMCLKAFELLGIHQPLPREPKVTYSPPEE